MGFHARSVAHFLLSIPLLHTRFRYNGINIFSAEFITCIADLLF